MRQAQQPQQECPHGGGATVVGCRLKVDAFVPLKDGEPLAFESGVTGELLRVHGDLEHVNRRWHAGRAVWSESCREGFFWLLLAHGASDGAAGVYNHGSYDLRCERSGARISRLVLA